MHDDNTKVFSKKQQNNNAKSKVLQVSIRKNNNSFLFLLILNVEKWI
jgi:hypothetical protein